MLEQLDTNIPEIEIEETNEKIKIPLRVLKLLAKILEVTSQGNWGCMIHSVKFTCVLDTNVIYPIKNCDLLFSRRKASLHTRTQQPPPWE